MAQFVVLAIENKPPIVPPTPLQGVTLVVYRV